MNKVHFSSIAEHNEALGLRPPEQPLFDIVQISSDDVDEDLSCNSDTVLSNDFYTISMKNIVSGEIHYGRTKYDCSNGTMLFTAPGQELRSFGVKIKSTARSIIIHEDFVRGHALKEKLKKYSFFNYSIHEALHLSPKEQKQLQSLFDSIELEYHNNFDAFTKELILSQIDTILKYSDRFYHRQFLLRKESDASMLSKFEAVFERLNTANSGIPSVEEISAALHVSSRYLSDALKSETGKTAKEWVHLKLIDLSKDLLLSSDDSVASIAYSIGFEYPQYFARLFKKKVGLTPTEYRQKFH